MERAEAVKYLVETHGMDQEFVDALDDEALDEQVKAAQEIEAQAAKEKEEEDEKRTKPKVAGKKRKAPAKKKEPEGPPPPEGKDIVLFIGEQVRPDAHSIVVEDPNLGIRRGITFALRPNLHPEYPSCIIKDPIVKAKVMLVAKSEGAHPRRKTIRVTAHKDYRTLLAIPENEFKVMVDYMKNRAQEQMAADADAEELILKAGKR